MTTVRTSPPLIVKSMGGVAIPIEISKGEKTIKEIKEQVAEKWNNKHHTEYTYEDILLAGPGKLVGKEDRFVRYQDTDVISNEELNEYKNHTIHLTIQPKKPAKSQDLPKN